jgi:hypothetical protein
VIASSNEQTAQLILYVTTHGSMEIAAIGFGLMGIAGIGYFFGVAIFTLYAEHMFLTQPSRYARIFSNANRFKIFKISGPRSELHKMFANSCGDNGVGGRIGFISI